MFKKSTIALFSIITTSSITIFPESYEVTSFVLFLRNLSYVMWHSFFFVPMIFGALFMGNVIYIIKAIILLSCMITIESYLLHRFIKKPCRSIVPRMIFINFANIFIQLLVAVYPLFYLIDLHNYVQDINNKIYVFYGLTIFSSIILLACRTTTAYLIYSWFDASIDKKTLKRAMIKTNIISYIFIVTIFLSLKLAGYGIL